MSDIPSFPYEILWGERALRSVANLTRADGEEFMALAPQRARATPEIQEYPLADANHALDDLRGGRVRGAAVLRVVRSGRGSRRGTDLMADVTVKRIEDFEAIFGGGFRRVRAGLGVTSFGIAVMDLPPNFKVYPEHDQSHDAQEEVYTVLSGRATLGSAARSTSSSRACGPASVPTRSARSSPATSPRGCWRSAATPGQVYEPPEFTHEGSTAMPMLKKELASPASAPAGRAPA